MSWVELSFDATGEAIDWVYSLLAKTDNNCQIHISRNSQDHLKNSTNTSQEWEFQVCVYIANDTYANSRIRAIANIFSSLQRTGLIGEIMTGEVADRPSSSNHSPSTIHHVGSKFVIIPSGVADFPVSSQQIVIQTKPFLAFGSGFHPATMLALQLIERHIYPGMTGLDLGSGSGILSVALAKLPTQVLALDNDSAAVQATRDLVNLNHVEAQVQVKQGSLGSGSHLGHWLGGEIDILEDLTSVQPNQSFEFIVANILARVHIQLAPEYQQALASTHTKGGILITAGFNHDRSNEVASAFNQAGFTLIDSMYMDEWVAFAHQLSMNNSQS